MLEVIWCMLAMTKAFWKDFWAMFWISVIISVGAKYQRRAIVTVWDPLTMQKFASKTIFRGPFWGSIGQGDCKITTPDILTEPGELTFMFDGDAPWSLCASKQHKSDAVVRGDQTPLNWDKRVVLLRKTTQAALRGNENWKANKRNEIWTTLWQCGQKTSAASEAWGFGREARQSEM